MNLIFGAGGHALEIEWLLSCEQNVNNSVDYIIIPDSDKSKNSVNLGSQVLFESDVKKINFDYNGYIAIGSSKIRKSIWQNFNRKGVTWPILKHNSVIADARNNSLRLGEGTIIFPGCILTSRIFIGRHVHINTGCIISHEVKIGNFCTLSPGVKLAGKVNIGDEVFIGLGVNVIDNIKICSNVIIGAGSLVLSDINEPGTYVGIPAKKIK
jgi:sugar O-acyltransferase (sialic acid O-acetyltransferase NeuD family)